MKLTAREKKLLILLGIVICLFAYFKFIFMPEMQRIADLKQEREALKLQVMKAGNRDKLLEDASRKLDELNRELSGYESLLAGSIYAPELLEELITEAGRLDVGVENIRFEGDGAVIKGRLLDTQSIGQGVVLPDSLSSPDGSDLLDSVAFSFSFRGSYQACLEFINYYETSKDNYIVEHLEFDRDEDMCTGEVRIRAMQWLNRMSKGNFQ